MLLTPERVFWVEVGQDFSFVGFAILEKNYFELKIKEWYNTN